MEPKCNAGCNEYVLLKHAWDRSEMHTNLLSENLTGRDHLEDLGVDGTIILEWILGK
jgi:hypothetical protein